MGQMYHGCARTTKEIRRTIQESKESITKLANRYHLNPKTVQKWRKRDYVDDSPMGPKSQHSTVLSIEEEGIIIAFRKYTHLPLDDCLYSLQETITKLTRSSLYRCLKRHGVSRLPHPEGYKKPEKKPFKKYSLGYFHLDITEIRTEEGKLNLFVAIDRTSKLTYVQSYQGKDKIIMAEFLRKLIDFVPYKIHTILTDNGIQFTNRKQDKYAFMHIFDRVCLEHNIEHRLTQVNHPWTNGQVERMNRIIKEATVKIYYYVSHEKFPEHLHAFLNAYNFAKRLKTLGGLTPYEKIIRFWKSEPDKFIKNPNHHKVKPYT